MSLAISWRPTLLLSDSALGQKHIASGRGSAQDLLRLQAQAERTLVISATRKCPLSCKHCITRSSPRAPGPILSPNLARVMAADFRTMHGEGLENVSITGGEPILALEAVSVIANAAQQTGLRTFVVTSAAWATTPETAQRVVARVGPVTGWDIGTDAWHAQEMPLERIAHAINAISETGASITLRACLTDDPEDQRRMRDALVALANGRGEIVEQSVRSIGRADHRATSGRIGLPKRPCVSTGLFVRADGSTGPCCAGLAYEAPDSYPMDYGVIKETGDLHAVWRAWRDDGLLDVMRSASLAALEGWLPERLQLTRHASDPCEACVRLWPRISADERKAIAQSAGQPAVREKITELKKVLFAQCR